jgi:CRISPR-associated protein Cmr2
MNKYMLMFSLGPVQPFIEQARKTRDLWLGSYLLSKLMEAAMEGIDEQKIVFPSEKKVKELFANLPNKYVAIFEDYKAAKEAAEASRTRISTFWNDLRGKILDDFVEKYADDYTHDVWKRQSNPEACFDIRWVIVESSSDSYKDLLKHAEEAFEARKRLHNFQQCEEPGEKSTISGERQALCASSDGHIPDRREVKDFWKTLTKREKYAKPFSLAKPLSAKDISLDGSERLDSIDTIKRFATRSPLIGKSPFPSTSSIATASFVEGVLSAKLQQNTLQAWKAATDKLDEIPLDAIGMIPILESTDGENKWILQRDGDCYFRATFTSYRLQKDYGIADDAHASKLANDGRSGLETLFEATDKLGLHRPTPYYAVLKMDGDRMGKLLGSVESIEAHTDISKALSAFTNKDVVHIVNESYPGRLIYAGGDDVLALVPLARNLPKSRGEKSETIKTVIQLANQLQLAYRDRIKRDATASTSIVIAHHYAPLSYVLGVMRRAEREIAKKRFGRNSLVVSVIRRSGMQTQVGCRWDYPQPDDQTGRLLPIDLFSQFYDLFERDILSPKCVHILLEEAPALAGLYHDQNAQISEIKRVLLRQRNESKISELPDSQAKDLASQLVWLAGAINQEHSFTGMSVNLEDDEPHHGLVEVLGWLLVMTFLTRKEED